MERETKKIVNNSSTPLVKSIVIFSVFLGRVKEKVNRETWEIFLKNAKKYPGSTFSCSTLELFYVESSTFIFSMFGLPRRVGLRSAAPSLKNSEDSLKFPKRGASLLLRR